MVLARQELLGRAPRLAAAERPALATDSAGLDEFEKLADSMDYFPADRPLVCELSGSVIPVHRVLGGSYWRRHCCEPAEWTDTLKTIAAAKCDVALEIGPSALLYQALGGGEPSRAQSLCLESLSPGGDATATLLDAAARLHVQGFSLDFAAMNRPWSFQRLGLPTYPFQRSHYWITDVGEYLK